VKQLIRMIPVGEVRRLCRMPRVTLDEAFALVRQEVEVRMKREQWNDPLVVIDLSFGTLWWAWAIGVQSSRYVETRDWLQMYLGLGPYLVDRFTAELIETGTGSSLHEIERSRGYRATWNAFGTDSIMEIQFIPRTTYPATSSG